MLLRWSFAATCLKSLVASGPLVVAQRRLSRRHPTATASPAMLIARVNRVGVVDDRGYPRLLCCVLALRVVQRSPDELRCARAE